MLLSVHVAKAGGTSLGFALREAFGERLVLDYADDPANPTSARNLDPRRHLARRQSWPTSAECVHGHFHPAKYDIPKDAYAFTLLRDPVENIISIHYFWKNTSGYTGPIGDYAKNNCDTVLDTAKLPILQRLYSETYFSGFEMTRFNRIGRHEEREAALGALATDLSLSISRSTQLNVTPDSDERGLVKQDYVIRSQLRDILIEDVRFYERWAA